MPKVYIANVTAQNHEINFRLPESRKPLSLKITMGQQRLVGDLSPPEIEAMVEQLGPYGLVELGQDGKREKISYLYNVHAPVPASAIQKVYDRNRGLLREEGTKRRQESAVAANDVMNTADTPIKNLTVDVEEVDSGSLGSDSDNVAEGVRIDNEANTSENKRPRSSKRRAGA